MMASPNRSAVGPHPLEFLGSPLLDQFASPCQSPLDQFLTPFSPPVNLASWSPPNVSIGGASPGIFSTTPIAPQSGTPVPPPPATWGSPFTGMGPLSSAPPQHAAQRIGSGSPVPPPPATWAPGAQSIGLVSPVPPPPATWGTAPASPAPSLPASWGFAPTSPAPHLPAPSQFATAQTAIWGGMPSCPPPSWPAPESLEGPFTNAIWMDQDMREAMPGVCSKPLKVFMEHLECEVMTLDTGYPARKGVPEWL